MLGMRCGVIVGDVSVVFDAKRPNFPQFMVSVLVIRDYFILGLVDVPDIDDLCIETCYTIEESYSCFGR